MKTLDRILNVFGKNLGYTLVLIVAIVFFAYFSDGLIPGLLTAFSALVAYICGAGLYRAFRDEFSGKKTVTDTIKKAPAKRKTSKK